MGLGDPNNHPFILLHCRLGAAKESCFHILNTAKGQKPIDGCYPGEMPANEIEHHRYSPKEILLNSEARRNRTFTTATNHLMPSFVENLLRAL